MTHQILSIAKWVIPIGFLLGWFAWEIIHAPVIKDERMENSLLLGIVLPESFKNCIALQIAFPAAVTIVVITIMIGLFSWSKIKMQWRTNHYVHRQLKK